MMNSLPAIALLLLTCAGSLQLKAQGGPPMRTDDPGTPGNGNFEVNVALTSDRRIDERVFEAPLLDINYGLGERVQLKFEIPFVVRGTDDGPTRSGPGNSLAGVKWRFLDNQRLGLQVSAYPQLEFNNPTSSVKRGLVEHGLQLLLPVEVTKKAGPVDVNVEAGYIVRQFGSHEWISGLAVGRDVTRKLELVGELYTSGHTDGEDIDTTADAGMRYRLGEHLVLLLMLGRGIEGDGRHFVGYGGIQFLFPVRKKSAARAPGTEVGSGQ